MSAARGVVKRSRSVPPSPSPLDTTEIFKMLGARSGKCTAVYFSDVDCYCIEKIVGLVKYKTAQLLCQMSKVAVGIFVFRRFVA